MPAGGGLPIAFIAAGAGAFLLLLFLILLIGLCAARRKKDPKPAASGAGYGSEEVDQDYLNVSNATANGVPPQNGHAVPAAPPPPDPHAQVHYNNGFTDDQGVTKAPAVSVIPAGAPPKLKKRTYKKRNQKPKGDPNDFQFSEQQKVATVIHRLARRLRTGIDSIRFSSGGRDAVGQDQFNPHNDPEAGAGVHGEPQRPQHRGPKAHKTYDPQLHPLSRGFAPASRVVPQGNIKSTWGRWKGKQNKTK